MQIERSGERDSSGESDSYCGGKKVHRIQVKSRRTAPLVLPAASNFVPMTAPDVPAGADASVTSSRLSSVAFTRYLHREKENKRERERERARREVGCEAYRQTQKQTDREREREIERKRPLFLHSHPCARREFELPDRHCEIFDSADNHPVH